MSAHGKPCKNMKYGKCESLVASGVQEGERGDIPSDVHSCYPREAVNFVSTFKRRRTVMVECKVDVWVLPMTPAG